MGGIDDGILQLTYDLKGHVESSETVKWLDQARGNQMLSQVATNLIEKVEGRKYDQALFDALRALMAISSGETASLQH